MAAELPVNAIVLLTSESLPAENLIAAVTDLYPVDFRWNPNINTRNRLRSAVSNIPDNQRLPKMTCTQLLSCSIHDFAKYLESKWLPGMHWYNYGTNGRLRGWEVDHIIGVCNWDLTKRRHIRSCFHYSNTQPLWARLNSKKTKFTPNVDINLYLLPEEPEDNEEEKDEEKKEERDVIILD
jgi:hypothetical protein